MKSYLGKYAPRSPATPQELFELRRKAWLAQGILVVHKDQVADDWQRVTIESIGNELYGRRGDK